MSEPKTIEKQKVCALLPMKAHSARVPNKNIRNFNDQPLYSWIIKSLDQCSYIHEILIDTDSEEILKNATQFSPKVKCLPRHEELLGDWAPFLDILKYDMQHSECDHFIQTHSTNPMLSTKTLNTAIETYFKNKDADSLFGASRLRSRIYDKNMKAINHEPTDRLLRTQDLPLIWEENSTFYLFSRQSFADSGDHRLGKKTKAFEVPDLEALDIDEEDDFIIAEAVHKLKMGS